MSGLAGWFARRAGLELKRSGGKRGPNLLGRRATAEELMQRETLAYVRRLKKLKPAVYDRVMEQRILDQFGGGSQDDALLPDPLDGMLEMAGKVRQLSEALNPTQPASGFGEVAKVIGDVLRSPMAGAVMTNALRGADVGPSSALPRLPASAPGPAPVPQPAPAPAALSAVSIPLPAGENEAPSAPDALPDPPEIPLDRFLPLLDLSPKAAALALVTMADEDEEKEDETLWDHLDLIVKDGADALLGTLAIIAYVPRYRETARKLLGRKEWVRLLVDELRALTTEAPEVVADNGRALS